jgi:hypothetical protein
MALASSSADSLSSARAEPPLPSARKPAAAPSGGLGH